MEGETNGLQIAGFVVSLVGLVLFDVFGLVGLVGLILSAVGRSQARQVGGKTGLGTAGVVLGIISMVLGFILSVYSVSLFM